MINLNYRLAFLVFLFPLILGIYIGSKYCPNIFVQDIPNKIEQRKIIRHFDNGGHLADEVITENISTPSPPKKALYRVTLFPVYSWNDRSPYYGITYEKPYTIPMMGEVFLGLYINTKSEIGFSLSKDFY